MDKVYKIVYSTGALLILISFLGGSLFSGLYGSLSKTTLEMGGIKEQYITSADDKIDDAFYLAKKVERSIDQLKNFFSREDVDESKYEKEKNYIIRNSVYDPFVNVLSVLYRIITFFTGVFFLPFGFVLQMLNGLMRYRNKISTLELKIYELEKMLILTQKV